MTYLPGPPSTLLINSISGLSETLRLTTYSPGGSVLSLTVNSNGILILIEWEFDCAVPGVTASVIMRPNTMNAVRACFFIRPPVCLREVPVEADRPQGFTGAESVVTDCFSIFAVPGDPID